MGICANCIFYSDLRGEVGECRRHPPKIISAFLHSFILGDDAQDEDVFFQFDAVEGATCFPVVSEGMGCGEFRQNPSTTGLRAIN